MIIKLTLTEDHLKLVRMFNIVDYEEDVSIDKTAMLTVMSHILDDIALVLGLRDKAISGTEESADGAAYPDDVEKYMLDTYNYVRDNMYNIETLLHQFAVDGVKPGTYKCKDSDLIWEKVEEEISEERLKEIEAEVRREFEEPTQTSDEDPVGPLACDSGKEFVVSGEDAIRFEMRMRMVEEKALEKKEDSVDRLSKREAYLKTALRHEEEIIENMKNELKEISEKLSSIR